MAYSAAERETTVTTSDADPWVHIHTYQRPYMTKLLANPDFEVLVRTDDYLRVRIAGDKWNPASGARRKRTYTAEQRAAAGKRLAAARQAKG